MRKSTVPTARQRKSTAAKPPARPPAKESLNQRRARVLKILSALHEEYANATCALSHVNPFQLLIATILSAQSTDDTVNKVTPILFARFPTPHGLADAPREEVERIIHSTGFFRQKARSIQGACRRIVEEFGGAVPQMMDALVTLPGVARKTANVVLGTAFGKNEGVVVDTHVGRLATRLELTWNGRDGKDAVRIERDLMEIVPREEWTFLSHALIWHGRRICLARKPDCAGCALANVCPNAGKPDSRLPRASNQPIALRTRRRQNLVQKPERPS